MMLDIDLFKSVNDQFGHKAGDAVLVEIARLLKKHLREVDTVSRWGGEEFVALMPQTGPEDAMAAATRIKEGIAGAVFTEAPGRKVTVSIGIATGGHETVNAEKLIDAADTALYQAKRNGRNRIELAA
jgi:diguanylate cyclase (GGDEF)-like protein